MLATSLVSLLLMATALHGATFKGSPPPTSDSIYVGGNADIKDYPYQVSLRFESNLICEGSIIANEWILTAAHSIKYEGKNVYVVAGTSNLNEGGTVHQVDKIIVHPNFRYTDKNVPVDDIALLKLDKPIVYDDKHQAIELFNKDEETRPGVLGVVTGFGRTGQGFLNQLQFVVVPIMSPTICVIVYSHKRPNKQFCAAYYEVGVKDACEGNSGGPLTINGRLAGIISWAMAAANPNTQVSTPKSHATVIGFQVL